MRTGIRSAGTALSHGSEFSYLSGTPTGKPWPSCCKSQRRYLPLALAAHCCNIRITRDLRKSRDVRRKASRSTFGVQERLLLVIEVVADGYLRPCRPLLTLQWRKRVRDIGKHVKKITIFGIDNPLHFNQLVVAEKQGDFVLAHYVSVGVEELDQEKLTPLLRLRYHDSLSDALADLGRPEEIGQVFSGFQRYLYEREGEFLEQHARAGASVS